MSVEGAAVPEVAVEGPLVHVEVGGGGLHDGAVRGLERHVEEERRGGVVTLNPGDCRPEKLTIRELSSGQLRCAGCSAPQAASFVKR